MRASNLTGMGFLWLMVGCTVHHHYPPAPAPAPLPSTDEVSECAPLLPAPEALSDEAHSANEEHSHPHTGSKEPLDSETSDRPRIIPHGELQSFENAGTTLVGLATAGQGATNFEVWRSSIPPGGSTPIHVHETEEIFVILAGEGTLYVGGEEFHFHAPSTVIAPAGIPHQVKNTGDVPTDQIVIVGVGSKIKNAEGKVLDLPWRQ